jgi:SAM-dependent methyltransferase
VLDVGCGRGEWLEVLRDAGIAAYGCDTNEVMVSRCKNLGLDVEVEDALNHLRSMPADSLGAVTGFHVMEHLPLAEQEVLLHESLRVLCPGGIALFETPNPENLSVGGHFFYTDPTHLRPLPPALLAHMANAAGFASTHIVRLHPDPRLAIYLDDSVSPLEQDTALQLFGPQDFALIALKQAPEKERAAVQEEVARLDASTLPPVDRAPPRALRLQQQLDAALQAKEAERAQLEAALQAKEAEAMNRIARADAEALAAKAHAYSANQQLNAVYASYSWRITKPMRLTSHWFRQSVIRPLGRALLSQPRLAKPIKQLLRKRPALFHFLKSVVLANTGDVFVGHATHEKGAADRGDSAESRRQE